MTDDHHRRPYIARTCRPRAPHDPAQRGLPRPPKKSIAGLVILVVFAVLAIIGPMDRARIAPASRTSAGCRSSAAPVRHRTFVPYPLPGSHHWLGPAIFAQDVWSQLLVGTRATVAGRVSCAGDPGHRARSVIVGVTAGYLGGGGDEGLSLVAQRLSRDPRPAPAHRARRLRRPVRRHPVLVGVDHRDHRVGVRRAGAAERRRCRLRNRDFVEAARVSGREHAFGSSCPKSCPTCSPIAASSFLFTTLYAIGAYVALVPRSCRVTDIYNWGTDAHARRDVASARGRAAGGGGGRLPGCASRLLGTGLALLNFGIDEFINPRLRDAGFRRKDARANAASAPAEARFHAVVRRPATAARNVSHVQCRDHPTTGTP